MTVTNRANSEFIIPGGPLLVALNVIADREGKSESVVEA
jgi:hypothetical protein